MINITIIQIVYIYIYKNIYYNDILFVMLKSFPWRVHGDTKSISKASETYQNVWLD